MARVFNRKLRAKFHSAAEGRNQKQILRFAQNDSHLQTVILIPQAREKDLL